MKDGVALVVAEADVVEPHVPPQGDQGAVRLLPGPAARLFPAGGEDAVFFPDVHQLDLAFVHLGGQAHGLENPLGARHGRQQQVALLGELVDGQSRLPHKHQIAGQAADVGHPVQHHQAAHHRHDGVVDVGNAHHRRDHGGGVALGAGARLAEDFVLLPEHPQVLGLVVEDLDHFLAADHLFNVAVDVPQGRLLGGVVGGAAAGAEPDVEEHGRIAHHHDQGQPPVQDEQQSQGAHDLDEALDGHGKAVVQSVRHGVHVVGEIAHDVAVELGVEEPQGQGLDVGEQVPPDVIQHLLGRIHHGLGVAEGRQGADGKDDGGEDDTPGQGVDVPSPHAVDHRADHVGAQQVAQGAEGDQHRHRQEQELVPPHVGQQGLEGEPEILGLFTGDLMRHLRPLLSSGSDRFPGRWGRWPAAGCGCPPHGCGRPPAPRSCRCPSPR